MLVVDPSGDLADVPGLVRLLADGTHAVSAGYVWTIGFEDCPPRAQRSSLLTM